MSQDDSRPPRTAATEAGLSDLERAVLDRVDPAMITALTAALVEADSENPGGTEAAAVAVLADACGAAGLRVERHEVAPGRPNLTATLDGGGGPGLMFLGHSDVVPAGPNWTGDPYRVRHAGGRLIGRGTTDMKGGLAAVVAALSALHDGLGPGAELPGPARLVCTVDEEEHGIGVRDFVSRPADHAFLGCVVAEPTGLHVVRGCRGASYLEVDITGRAAHSGRPSDGRNAIVAAAAVIELIRADQDELHRSPDPLLGSGTWNVGTIEGGQGISVVAPTCSLGVDRRLMPEEDAGAVADRLRAAVIEAGIDTDGIDVDVRVTMEMPGFATPATDPLVIGAAEALTAAAGITPVIGGWSAACDGGFVSRDLGVPAVVLGPGDLNTQAHQPDESVAVDDLVAAARVYALMALRMLG